MKKPCHRRKCRVAAAIYDTVFAMPGLDDRSGKGHYGLQVGAAIRTRQAAAAGRKRAIRALIARSRCDKRAQAQGSTSW